MPPERQLATRRGSSANRPAGLWYTGPALPKIRRGILSSRQSWELRAETNARRGVSGGERTIVVFGNSIVFGWPLRYEDSYPARLEHMLRDRSAPPHWEVINAGVPGNTVLLGAERYDRDVQAFWPSTVVIQFGLNDGALRRTRFDAHRERVWRAQRTRRARLWVTLGGILRRGWLRQGGDSRRVVHRPVPRVGAPAFADALGDIVRRVRATGASPWLMSLIPLRPGSLSANQWRAYRQYDDIIREVASSTDSGLVDLQSTNGAPFDAYAMLADDGIHLTEDGHIWLAQRLGDCLLPIIAEAKNESHQANPA